MSIVVSSLTIATQMALSHFIRGRLSEMVEGELLKGCLLELVAAAEMCGTCFELIISEWCGSGDGGAEGTRGRDYVCHEDYEPRELVQMYNVD